MEQSGIAVHQIEGSRADPCGIRYYRAWQIRTEVPCYHMTVYEGWNVLYKKLCTQTELVVAFATDFSCAVSFFKKKNVFYFFVLIVLCWRYLKPIHKLFNWLFISQNVVFPHGGPHFLVNLHDEYYTYIWRRQGLQVNKRVIHLHHETHRREITHVRLKWNQRSQLRRKWPWHGIVLNLCPELLDSDPDIWKIGW